MNLKGVDAHITGNWGEDQFKEEDNEPHIVFENGSVIRGGPNPTPLHGRAGDVAWIDDGDYRGVKIPGPHIHVGDEVTYEIPYTKRQERHGIVERVYQRATKDGPVETARVRWPDGGFGYAKTADLIEVGDIG